MDLVSTSLLTAAIVKACEKTGEKFADATIEAVLPALRKPATIVLRAIKSKFSDDKALGRADESNPFESSPDLLNEILMVSQSDPAVAQAMKSVDPLLDEDVNEFVKENRDLLREIRSKLEERLVRRETTSFHNSYNSNSPVIANSRDPHVNYTINNNNI